MKKIILTTAILVAMSINAHAISLSAHKIETKVKKQAIVNASNNESEEVLVYVTAGAEEFKPIPAGAEDCSSGIKIYPKQFSLKPGESQEVKFIGKKAGYCRAFFYPDPIKKDEVAPEQGVTIKLRFKTGIPVQVI